MVQKFTVKCGEAWMLAQAHGKTDPFDNLIEDAVFDVSDEFLFENTDENVAEIIKRNPDWWGSPSKLRRSAERYLACMKFNLYLKADILDGDPKKLKTFESLKDATLDKMNETTHIPNTCHGNGPADGHACVRTYVWHRDSDADARVHHDHRIHHKCKNHRHLDDERCHAQIQHEGRHMSNVLIAAEQMFGTPVGEFHFKFNANRELEVSHSRLTAAGMDKLQKHVRATYPNTPTHVKPHPIHKEE